jgi:DNA-directed RNA polymerase subunit K/omega
MSSTRESSKFQPKYLVEAVGPEIDETAHEILLSRQQKYLMVNMLARRARELNRGERALVDLPPPVTHTELALEEIRQDKLQVIRKQTSRVLVNMIDNE